MRAVDCHAHYVSPRALRALEAPGALERYGVALIRDDQGSRLRVGAAPPTFPLPKHLADLERAQDLDQMGIGTQAIGSWLEVSGYALPIAQGAAWCRLLNDSAADDIEAAGAGRRFVGMAAIPLQDGRLAAEELERCIGTLGFAGSMIGTNVDGRGLDDPSLDPFWETAQAARVPVVLHPGYVGGRDRTERYWLTTLLGYPFDTTIAAASLIFGGTLDRFPELSVVLLHGGGYLPYQVGRLSRGYVVRPETQSHGAGEPRDYLRRFHYDTMLFSDGALKYLVDLVGIDRIVLGSDYPFDLGDPAPLDIVRQACGDEAAIEQVAVHNGGRLLRLDAGGAR